MNDDALSASVAEWQSRSQYPAAPGPPSPTDRAGHARVAAGSKGNKTEQPGPLAFSMLLAVPCVAFLVYFIRFQTFV